MSRVTIAVAFILIANALCFGKDDPKLKIPTAADVARYERPDPIDAKDKTQEFPRSHGDEILAALDGGKAVVSWRETWPPGVICVLPVQTPRTVTAVLKDGTRYTLRFSVDGCLADLPQGYYVVNEAVRGRIVKVLAWVSDEQRKQLLSQPWPITYSVE